MAEPVPTQNDPAAPPRISKLPPGRKTRSSRSLSFGRTVLDWLLTFLGVLAVEFWWRTCRIHVVGEDRLKELIDQHGAVLPVCWHQHLLLCSRWAVAGRIPGMNIGFLVSPSLDGNAPSDLARLYGATVIRGSSTYTGPQAVRSMYKQIREQKLSPLITPDGPKGPRFEFKAGAIALAQLSGVPVVPIAFAAKTAKVFRTWDKFILPMPFTRVVLMVGDPFVPPRKATPEEHQQLQVQMAERMHDTYRRAAAVLNA